MDCFLSFYDVCVVGDEGFVSNNQFNGLFSINKITGAIQWLGFFPGENKDKYGMHKKIIFYNGSFVFIPECGSYIHIYKDGMFSKIRIRDNNNEKPLFAEVLQIDNRVYLIPYNVDEQRMLSFNIDTMNLNVDKEFNDICKKYVQDRDIQIRSAVLIDDTIQFAFVGTNLVGIWKIYDKKLEIIELEKNMNLCGIYNATTGGNILTLLDTDSVCSFDGERITKIYPINQLEGSTIGPINGIVNYCGADLILPNNSKRLFYIKDGNLCEILDYPDTYQFLAGGSREWAYYTEAKEVDGCLWILPFKSNAILIVNSDFQIIDLHLTNISDMDNYEKLKYPVITDEIKSQLTQGIAEEKEDISLECFIKLINE